MADLLYHGSISPVERIDLTRANPRRDFGAGFYTTSSLDQAIRFAWVVARRNRLSQGVVSVYRYEGDESIQVRKFESADLDWLDFVLENHRQSAASKPKTDTDLIIGPVANDQVGQTLNLLITGAYGDPQSKAAQTFALSLLLTEKLVDQWVFKTDKAIKELEFIRAEEYGL